MRYVARCPLRLDVAGYWTSIPVYAEREGGAVLGASIQPYVRGSVARAEPEGPMHALRGDRHYVSYALDLPRGAGLGASSAQTVLWVTMVRTVIANVSDRMQIAEIARSTESQLAAGAGSLDPYICAHGGWGLFTTVHPIAAQALTMEPSRLKWLETHMVLAYTGPAPPSSVLIDAVSRRFADENSLVKTTMATMKSLVPDARDAVLAGDPLVLAEIVRAQWALHKQLEQRVTTPTIDATLEFALKHGALAGKLCGAGGGGCFLFIVPFERQVQLRAALAQRRLQTIDVRFDSYGVHLSKR